MEKTLSWTLLGFSRCRELWNIRVKVQSELILATKRYEFQGARHFFRGSKPLLISRPPPVTPMNVVDTVRIRKHFRYVQTSVETNGHKKFKKTWQFRSKPGRYPNFDMYVRTRTWRRYRHSDWFDWFCERHDARAKQGPTGRPEEGDLAGGPREVIII